MTNTCALDNVMIMLFYLKLLKGQQNKVCAFTNITIFDKPQSLSYIACFIIFVVRLLSNELLKL